MGDTGVTGRKIIVDTYGGMARHGGGAFSGKDPTKVDRSAAYAARYVAKNVVAAGLAERCELQVAYAIGVAQPVSIEVECFGTERVPVSRIEELVREHFDLRPAAILRDLDLRRPIYAKTAALRSLRSRRPRLHVGANRQGGARCVRPPASSSRRARLIRWALTVCRLGRLRRGRDAVRERASGCSAGRRRTSRWPRASSPTSGSSASSATTSARTSSPSSRSAESTSRTSSGCRAARTFFWRGRYDFDLNTAHTLETQLNVFAEFEPHLSGDVRRRIDPLPRQHPARPPASRPSAVRTTCRSSRSTR